MPVLVFFPLITFDPGVGSVVSFAVFGVEFNNPLNFGRQLRGLIQKVDKLLVGLKVHLVSWTRGGHQDVVF